MIQGRLYSLFCTAITVALLLVSLPTAAGAAEGNGAEGSCPEGTILYVDDDAPDGGTGTSWQDAYQDLQQALTSAEEGDQIWVAAGIYKPSDEGDRWATFALKKCVALYGGFAGTETSLAERDWETNISILSGDLYDDDGPNFANNTDNSNSVVTSYQDANHSTRLDGFTITAGYAAESGTEYIWPCGNGGNACGGGMLNDGGSPNLVNLIFEANKADYGGGGLLSKVGNGSDRPCHATLTNVTFHGNQSSHGGGMANFFMCSSALTNVTFLENIAAPLPTDPAAIASGGGMFEGYSNSTLRNVSFVGNTARAGGAMYIYNHSNPLLVNVSFINNKAASSGGGLNTNLGNNPLLINVTFAGNSAEIAGGAIANNDVQNAPSTLIIRNSILWDDLTNGTAEIFTADTSTTIVAHSVIKASGGSGADWNVMGIDDGGNLDEDPLFVDASNGDLHLLPISPAIDAGNSDYIPTDVTTDADGNPRIVGIAVDVGAYEVQIVDMITYLKTMVESLPLPKGTLTSLLAKLDTKALEDTNPHNDMSVLNRLTAFVKGATEVAPFNELIDYAETIAAAMTAQMNNLVTTSSASQEPEERVFLPALNR